METQAMEPLNFCSVETLPSARGAAAFTVSSQSVFREDGDLSPVSIGNRLQYMPWGVDNQMPYQILRLIEDDETLSTCQMFNAEVCYGSGLNYVQTSVESQEPRAESKLRISQTQREIDDFFDDNDMPSYFLGTCQDIKHFAFAVSVVILNADGSRIVRLLRKEACYCRFAPADKQGRIPRVYFANWRRYPSKADEIESIELLDPASPYQDLRARLAAKTRTRKFAIVTRVPTPDSTYYPIPYYASLFHGKWYDIKQLVGTAKEAKLRNSAPIKYQIEISAKYWDSIFKAEGITDRRRQQERIVTEKRQILDFLTGAENSGKVWFSTFYVSPDGHEQHDVVITRIDDTKEGGDWATDIQEAVNMICFTMRVHSNLVGSVPGKAQSNNSGSDKRELYTIAQALQEPYHDLLFGVHRMIIRHNGWTGYRPVVPFIQLTTLDEHADARQVTTEQNPE